MNKTEKNPSTEVNFPQILTPKDIELVITECKIQHAETPEEIQGFADAYAKAKDLALKQELKDLKAEEVETLILELGKITDKVNSNGWRTTPVTFANLTRGLDADKIPQAIKSFCEGFVAFLQDPTEDERLNIIMLYKEFETIHPFEDGNGRVGDLLWKILKTRKDGQWPEELPPEVF